MSGRSAPGRAAALALLLLAAPGPAPAAGAELAPAEAYPLLQDVISPERKERKAAAARLAAAGDASLVPALVDAYFFTELARKGETVEREPRPIRIDAIELLEAAGTRLVFRVRCSKGTYVRSLVEDIARAAGTVAHTARLHRETVAEFGADEMVDLESLEQRAADGAAPLRLSLLPPDRALTGLPEVTLAASDAERFCGGQAVQAGDGPSRGLVRVYGEEQIFLGVGEISANGTVAPRRVFGRHAGNP